MRTAPEHISEARDARDEAGDSLRSKVTRRELVSRLACASGALLVPIPFGVKIVHAEAAAAAAGVAVMFQVFSQLIALTQKSDSLGLELSAIRLDLNQILANQLFIIQALQEINDKIDDVRKQLNELPSEVISLKEAIDAETIATKLINRLKSLEGRPTDLKAQELFWSGIKEVEGLGYSLRAAVHQSTRQAGLAIAAKYLLHSVQIFLSSQRRFPVKDVNQLDALTNTASNLVDILSEMSGENGLRRLIKEQEQKTKLAANSLAKSRFASLLPKDIAAVSKESPGSKARSESTICFTTPLKSTKTGQSNNRARDTSPSTTFYYTESRDIRKVRYITESMIAIGGRAGYEVLRDDAKLWVSDGWSREIYKTDNGSRGVKSSQSEAKLQGCVEASDTAGASQEEFNAFLNGLAVFNTNVALESRLIAIRNSARNDLAKAAEVEQAFDKLRGHVREAKRKR